MRVSTFAGDLNLTRRTRGADTTFHGEPVPPWAFLLVNVPSRIAPALLRCYCGTGAKIFGRRFKVNASDGMTAAEEQNAKIRESACSAMQGSFPGRGTKKKFNPILT